MLNKKFILNRKFYSSLDIEFSSVILLNRTNRLLEIKLADPIPYAFQE